MNADLSRPDPTTPVIAPGFHASWADVAPEGWRWRNFTPRELACKCGGRHCRGEYFHNPDFLDGLQRLRADVGRPITLTSGRRCDGHNRAVGGATRSQHLLAIACDVSLMNHDPAELARAAVRAGFRGIGFGRSFLHLDWRETRTAFHYPDGKDAWFARLGFDPVVALRREWAL
jgi:zinc D-Ala-D-Ala carboxypeptidase